MPPGLMGMRPLAPAAAMMAAAQGAAKLGRPKAAPPTCEAQSLLRCARDISGGCKTAAAAVGEIRDLAMLCAYGMPPYQLPGMTPIGTPMGTSMAYGMPPAMMPPQRPAMPQSDPVSGQLAAFGFCEFADPLGAAKCIACLAGLKLQGRALVVNCNDKVRGEIAKVTEERIQATMRAYKHKTREAVEAEIEAEYAKLKEAVQELLNRKNVHLPTSAAADTSAGAAFHRLRKLDPEAIAAAAENSIYRIAPDGTDRRTYIDEDYRPSRRELERLQSAGRREAEYEREFTRREASWKIQEQNLAVDREKELVGELELSSEDKRKLIEQDLRGEWWEGLEDPSIRLERRRRRRAEAEDDANDVAAEQQELAVLQGGGGKKGSRVLSGVDSEQENHQEYLESRSRRDSEREKHKLSGRCPDTGSLCLFHRSTRPNS
ncbi:RNA-binding region rnp-1 domain-containing protein [Cyclospora cayetanensis]|uniref:RNA-binding region rnp-1 domain-containing protein n=1 Tax=Cyclospora cayetanensis TaxID=88456 RepID=A0A1D3CYD9_9EIME|nr:RNA-binding region rnp-1 domain-containing protein [Cyclospora cayetanensis]